MNQENLLMTLIMFKLNKLMNDFIFILKYIFGIQISILLY